ncbi:MAG: type II toxin-antitoxin system VapC family toxin [Alphaproteobacteria bacterium]|nr:type II toxin-antitoxin system VapC family toxin [Alphaproteobacteria bacterium]
MIILDTNVISEFTKAQVSVRVSDWLATQNPLELATTTVCEAELLVGIALLPDGRRKLYLDRETTSLLNSFGARIFPFDRGAARELPAIVLMRRSAQLSTDEADGQIAAIARFRGASIATRNVADFDHCAVSLVNPWTGQQI